jgi:hypothetical protein
MKLRSQIALAGALGLAMIAGGVNSAAAKEKVAPAPATPPLSKEFRAAAAPLQTAISAKTWPQTAALLDASDLAAKSPYEKFVAAQLRYQVGLGTQDMAVQKRAILEMLSSGAAPPGAATALNLSVGNDLFFANQHAKALPYLLEAKRLGSTEEQLPLLIAESYFKTSNVPAGMAELSAALAAKKAAGQAAPENWYARARAAAYNAKMDSATSDWSRMMIAAYPSLKNWRDGLVIYRDASSRAAPVNLDLFRLMRVTKSLDGERDYAEYAELATAAGLPGEAKAVIDEGFTLGKVPAGSRTLGELRALTAGKVAADRAGLPASERASVTSARTAFATAEAYLGYGDDTKAIALYRSAMAKGGIDMDAANMHLGMALLRSGQRDEARAKFASVTGARSEVAKFWTLFVDMLPKPAA